MKLELSLLGFRDDELEKYGKSTLYAVTAERLLYAQRWKKNEILQ